MSKGSRAREIEYGREERRPRGSDNSILEARVFLGGINAKNFSFREVQDWMSKYGKVIDVVFCERHILVQFDRESEATRAIDREKGQTFRGVRFDIRFAHSSDGSMSSSRSEVPRSRSPRTLPYDRSSRDMSPGFRDSVRERSPIDRDRYYKERRGNSPEYRGYDRPRVNTEDRTRLNVDDRRINTEDRARSNTRTEYPSSEYQEPNWNAPSLTNKVTAERPGFDAAIIVMSSDLLNYAETIESKLQRQIALTTHIIVLKEESHANACIEDLNNKAVLYAFLVNHMNEKHLSCTLRILYGNGQEHRNMLLTNALTFVSRNFEDYQKRVRELKSIAPKPNYDPSRMPPGFLAPDDKTIYQLHLLADSRMLTIEELNEVDEFIQKRIQVLAQAEGIIEKPNPMGIISNDSKGMIAGIPNVRDEKALIAQQNQLHSKILNILKPATQTSNVNEKDSINSGMDQFNTFSSESITPSANNPLTNPKVQQALDSLMQSKFRPNVHDQTDDSHSFSSVSQQSNQYVGVNTNMNSNMNPNMNTNLTSNMNTGMGMNPNINMNSGMNMNQGMNMSRTPNPMNAPVRGFQPGHPYASNYPGYYQPTQVGQPVYRARAPFQQPRPQYPGY